MRKIIFLNEQDDIVTYKRVSDINRFKENAKKILGGYGGLSDENIKKDMKDVYIGDKHVGYIGLNTHRQGKYEALGIGNFMIFDRGNGYGTIVMKDLIAKNKDKYDLIFCFVEKENKGAIKFYKRLGKVYDEDGPNDNGEYYVTLYDNGNWKIDE